MTWTLKARLIVCLLCGLLAGLPLSAKALAPAHGRPERTLHSSALSHTTGNAAGPAAGPIPANEAQAGPGIFSVRVQMHPLLKDYLELYSSPVWKKWLEMVMARAQPFLGYVTSRIAHYHLPPELEYLPIAESSYDPYAVSKAGAAGLWQLMPKTGHYFGLHINRWVDQRFDFWKATNASLETLKNNYRVLGNWLLALAAYDAGLDFMKELVARTGIHDYWTLAARGYLPQETVDYVPRFLAIAAICGDPAHYGLPTHWEKPLEWTRIKLAQSVDLGLLADEAKINRTLLLEGNAGYKKGVTPPARASYYLKVPRHDASGVDQVLSEGRYSLVLFYVYAVKRGDSLSRLARHYGVPVSMILRYNPHIARHRLQVGTWLLIPAVKNVRAYRPAPVPLTPAELRSRTLLEAHFTGSYTVRRGDTLWSIAARFATTPADVAEVNGLAMNGVIHPGLVLRVPPR